DGKGTRRLEVARCGDLLPPANLGMMNAHQVDRRTCAPACQRDCTIVAMEAADAHRPPLRKPFEFVADRNASRCHGSGDNRAVSGDRESTIDCHAEETRVVPRRHAERERSKRVSQGVDPQAGRSRGTYDLRTFQERARDESTYVLLD